MNQPNPLMQRFAGAAPAPGQAPAAPRAPASRYANVPAGNDRFPRPMPGRYRLRATKSGETQTNGKEPYFYIDFEVVSSTNGTPEGTTIHFDQCVGFSSLSAGGPKIKRALMALLGVDEPTFNAMSGAAGDGRELIDAAAGYPSVDANGQPYPENPFAGLGVDAEVYFGKPCKKQKPTDADDWYREYVWTAVPQG